MKESSASTWNENHFWLGLFSAMASSVFIGSSLVIQKKALSRLGTVKSRRAKSIDWNCLKDWLWLSGVFLSKHFHLLLLENFLASFRLFVLLPRLASRRVACLKYLFRFLIQRVNFIFPVGIGECFNFAAYALAPASLVAPLGAFSVIVAAGLSAKLLHEEINVLVWCGCIACILGSIVVIIHSPKTNFVYMVSDLVQGFKRPTFLFFCILTLLCVVALVALSPDYGKRNVLVYITICSLIGGYTVPACKALAVALVECISACSAQALYVTVISAVALVVCCAFQLYYLNKALNLFNTSLVTPIYYAFFTTAVVVSTGILFNEWIYLSTSDLLASFCGFLNILMGTFLMQVFKDVSVSMEQLRAMLRKRDRNASPDSTARLL
ncbi:hypothetical protein M514_01495 [Trichuris suis]|uniref:Magnesium transporter NIPA n=1 Tax=Trichuris suis TaxID=68888 RepID=A0A085NIA7_9BILA|nr:hypothetical protein M513_01495 [Trichuris suis]KFD69203.1 hypothetical protein M514_01495 [Trichuris suis]